MTMKAKKQKGYVLLLAVLISSIILAMSMGVFAISIKEVALATFARDSVRAFAASSRGLECAMFMDRINSQAAQDLGQNANYYSASGISSVPFTPFVRGNSPEFGLLTPTEYWPFTATLPDNYMQYFRCAGQTPTNYTVQVNGDKYGTSYFTLSFPDSCVKVTIDKQKILTKFTSDGYSDVCGNITSQRVTQRTIEVSVNI